MPRILITGASGFVGSRLYARLKAISGDDVLGVSGPRYADGIDLADAVATARLIDEFQPEVVIHLAAQSSVAGAFADPEGVWGANFDATRSLALAASRCAARPHFIFASTSEVYGAGFNDGPRSEASAISPLSPYGHTKAAAEMFLQDMAGDNLAVTILRLFNHTGPGQDGRFVIPAFAAQIAAAERSGFDPVVRVGNLDARRDFSDVEDIIDAYVAVACGDQPSGQAQVYNVGSGTVRRIGDLLDAMLLQSAAPLTIQHAADRMRPSEIPVAEGVFSRFQQDYSWCTKRDIAETLRAVLEQARQKKP